MQNLYLKLDQSSLNYSIRGRTAGVGGGVEGEEKKGRE